MTTQAQIDAAYIEGFNDCTNARCDRYAALTASAQVGLVADITKPTPSQIGAALRAAIKVRLSAGDDRAMIEAALTAAAQVGLVADITKPTPSQIGAAKNTDRELWREREGDYYADSIHATKDGAIGISVGGFVIVKPIQKWFALANKEFGTLKYPQSPKAALTASAQVGEQMKIDNSDGPPWKLDAKETVRTIQAATIERCAQVAEGCADTFGSLETRKRIAAAIRKLKDVT